MRTSLADGIQLGKGPEICDNWQSCWPGTLNPFSWLHLLPLIRDPSTSLLPLPSPLPSRHHYPIALLFLTHKLPFPPISFSSPSPYSTQISPLPSLVSFFFHPPSLLFTFPYWFRLFSTQSTSEKIFLLLNRICEMCCAYSSLAHNTQVTLIYSLNYLAGWLQYIILNQASNMQCT